MDPIRMFRDYLMAHPNDRFARYSLALELKKAGDLTAAEVELQRLLVDHPRSGAGYLQLGQLLEEADRLEDALAVYDRGLAALGTSDDAEARRSEAEIRRAREAVEDRL